MTTEIDLLNTIHEYADMGLDGLNQVIPLSSDPSFTRELQHQKSDYEEALKKAGKEGKMVFMDCYTVWCGPCKMMNERVFTQKVVGDYFKKHFIPLKVDMEKGEGIALRKKFDVNAFPTMFILDAEGNIVGKLQGARDTDIFLKELKEILGDE